jgi:hypothetical protein
LFISIGASWEKRRFIFGDLGLLLRVGGKMYTALLRAQADLVLDSGVLDSLGECVAFSGLADGWV